MTSEQKSKGVKWWLYLVVLAALGAIAAGIILTLPPEDDNAVLAQTSEVATPAATVQKSDPVPSPTVREAYIPDPDELQEIPDFDSITITGEIGVVLDEAESSLNLSWQVDPLADYYVLCVIDADGEEVRTEILWPDITTWEMHDFRGAGVGLLSYSDMGEDSAEDDALGNVLYTDVTSMMYGTDPEAAVVSDPATDGLSQYYILVDKTDHAFSIFTYDDNGEYTIKVATFPCAVGRSSRMTPTGTFSISSKGEWKRWSSGHYSPFYTRYTSGLYIHGPAYNSRKFDRMRPQSYNEIGTDASSGCLRTTVAGARFVYYNCPAGTMIEIVVETDLISWPGLPEIDPNFPTWDPTDPFKPDGPDTEPSPETTPAMMATPTASKED